MTNTLVTIGSSQAQLLFGRPYGYYQLTSLSKQTLPIAMSTQANALERANANAGKEYSF